MTTMPYLSDDDRALWQIAVDECPDCQALEGDDVCGEHDLDDETVALRYAGAAKGRWLVDSDTGEILGLATTEQATASDAAPGPEGHIRIRRATGEVVPEERQSAHQQLRRVWVTQR